MDKNKFILTESNDAFFKDAQIEDRWPQVGDIYYTVDFGLSSYDPIDELPWEGDLVDYSNMENGMAFRTREDAEHYYKRHRIENAMRKAADGKPGEEGYILYCDCEQGFIGAESVRFSRGIPMFSTADKAKAFVEMIGKDDMIRYWFCQ